MKSIKSLLQINSVINSGSTGRITEEIGQIALSEGWNSYIAFGRSERPSKSSLFKIGTDCDVKLHGVQTRLFDNHGFASKRATRKFIKEVERIKPSIIHLHNIHGYYINIEILFNYLAKVAIPVVWTLHDCWAFTGHCSHFDLIGCEKWKTQCYECPQKKSYPASLFIDNSTNNYTKKNALFNSIQKMIVVPVSYWLGDLVKESFLNRYPTKVIQNGIDIDAFNNKECIDIELKYSLENKFVILGVAGVWTNSKGFGDFVKLSQRLKEDEIIILVGLSRKQIELLPRNILGIERTENIEELAKLYSIADVFINPTYQDTFPTTNLEALACGTPVVTYKTGGSVESVDDKVGWIVEQGDIDALQDIITSMKSEPNSIKKQRELECRKKAERLYNKNDRFEEYFELYEELI